MIFNPLFISGANSVNELGKSKFANPNYLFTDIINVRGNASEIGIDESQPSFDSMLGVQANPKGFLISSSATESINDNAMKGYKLNEKEIAGVISELIKNSDNIEILKGSNIIYENKNPENNVFEILQKVIGEIAKGESVKLNLSTGGSEYSVELQSINQNDVNYNAFGGFETANSSKTVHLDVKESVISKESESKPEKYIKDLAKLLSESGVFDKIKNDLPAKTSEHLENLLSADTETAQIENYFIENPITANTIKEVLYANKSVVFEEMRDAIKSSSEYNLNPEVINKLNQIVEYVSKNKKERLPELINVLSETTGTETNPKNNNSLEHKIQKLFEDTDKIKEITAEILAELKDSSLQPLFNFYDETATPVEKSTEPNNEVINEITDILNSGKVQLKQVVPEIESLLESFDSKEVIKELLSDVNVAGIIKERLSGLLSKVSISSENVKRVINNSDLPEIETALLKSFKSGDSAFKLKMNELVNKYNLSDTGNQKIIAQSETLKPVIEAAMLKMVDNENPVKQIFQNIVDQDNSSSKEATQLNVNSTLENFLKIVANKSKLSVLSVNESENSKTVDNKKQGFILKITNSKSDSKGINELTKLITKENVSGSEADKRFTKLIEKNITPGDLESKTISPEKEMKPLGINSNESAKDKTVQKADSQNGEVKDNKDLKQLGNFTNSVNMKRSLEKQYSGEQIKFGESNKLSLDESASDNNVNKHTDGNTTIAAVDKKNNLPDDKINLKDSNPKTEIEQSDKLSPGQNSNTEGGSDNHKENESHKGVHSTAQHSTKQTGNNIKPFDTHLNDATPMRDDIQKRIKVIKDVELSRVNGELRNIAASRTSQNVTLKLNPVTLGEIEVAIEIIENSVNAKIEVENDAVKHVINSGMEQLKQNLVQQGLQPNNINVSLATPDEKNQKFTKNNKKKHSNSKGLNTDTNVENDTPKNMGYNTYDYVA